VVTAVRHIPRHDIDLDFAGRQVDDLGEEVADILDDLSGYTEGLTDLLSVSLMRAQYRSALDPSASQGPTWESIVLPMQASSAMFAAANIEDGGVDCRIDTKNLPFPATGARYWTNAGRWLTALWLAMICREKQRADMLCDTSVELLRASGAQYDDYVYPWIESLQMYWHGEQAYFSRLLEAMRGTPEEELVLLLLYPPMKVFSYLSQREVPEFNEALAEALDLHRHYWTRTADRAKDPEGYIALAPTALACLGTEMGISVEVESEYMPSSLVQGSWVGEFTT
jgi:hypothetical protein